MKKILASIAFVICGTQVVCAQDKDIRPAAIGVSFFLNDYTTPQRIRSGSLEQVLREDQVAKVSEMSPGVAVTYFQGLYKYIDFAGTVGVSFPRLRFSDDATGVRRSSALLEADASFNFKMFPERYYFTPYLIAGIGASLYGSDLGAIVPVGGGLKLNLFDESSLYITAQYRIPLVKNTNDYHFQASIGISGILGASKE